jgi:hypothetical protein
MGDCGEASGLMEVAAERGESERELSLTEHESGGRVGPCLMDEER